MRKTTILTTISFFISFFVGFAQSQEIGNNEYIIKFKTVIPIISSGQDNNDDDNPVSTGPCDDVWENEICEVNDKNLLVVDRDTLMKVLDGNVDNNLYQEHGKTWDVDEVYTGKVNDMSWRGTSGSGGCESNTPFIPNGFNDDISMWATYNVINMDRILACNETFNQPINDWDVSNVENFYAAFGNSTYNQSLRDWNMKSAVTIQSMFNGSKFKGNIKDWHFENLERAGSAFAKSDFNGDIAWTFDVPDGSISAGGMFRETELFNSHLNDLQVSKFGRIRGFFINATAFNQPINGWDVSNLNSHDAMNDLFRGASSFNQDLDKWKISEKITRLRRVFKGASSFNGNITTWNTENIGRFISTWENASSFNKDLSGWCVDSVDRIDDIEDYDKGANSWLEERKPDWPNCP